MYGINFLEDIYLTASFTVYERSFEKYEVLKDQKYFGRLHNTFRYPDVDETFTVYKYKSIEKHSMFDIEYIIELYVSDKNPKNSKAMVMKGVLGKGTINIDLAHDLMENSVIRHHADVVHEVIKELRLHLLKETMVNLYDADKKLMDQFFMENMSQEELIKYARIFDYRRY